jgi:RES domain-containing protein
MLEAWRIVRVRHATTAFSGEGAAKNGGRWNSRGVRVVYVSGNKSLAALETLVHLNPPIPFHYVIIRATFDDTMVKNVAVKALPPNWRKQPPPSSTKAVGDEWVKKAGSPILALPSVIIPSETNYLLNPAHPNFKKISIGRPEVFVFVFDSRLLT